MKLTGLVATCLFFAGMIYFHFCLGRHFPRSGTGRNMTTLMLGPPDVELLLKPIGGNSGEGRCGFVMASYETTDRLVISDPRHPVTLLVYSLNEKTVFLAFFGDNISVPLL
jgi:hypothetical protein